jgi:hypothetical protein
MDPWSQNPEWQNFSSLARETSSAEAARTGMEKSHHLAASLYFGIAALESFLNARMRNKMQLEKKSEPEVLDVLRKPRIKDKVRKWPTLLTGRLLSIAPATLEAIELFNDIRGQVTHPKKRGAEIYAPLERLDPAGIMAAISEYIVHFCEADGKDYPYWIFGWNYLNPRTASYEIMISSNDQFIWSLQSLGFSVSPTQASQGGFLRGLKSYQELKNALASRPNCEPKSIFPFKPTLCRRWWTPEHQLTCGNVSKEALAQAHDFTYVRGPFRR